MQPDRTREAVKAIKEAESLLAEVSAGYHTAQEKLRAALELARQSLDTLSPDKAERSCFAPPPLLFRVGVAAFMEGVLIIVAALALIVVVLALAFSKAHAPESGACVVKCAVPCEPKCVAPCESGAQREGGNG